MNEEQFLKYLFYILFYFYIIFPNKYRNVYLNLQFLKTILYKYKLYNSHIIYY